MNQPVAATAPLVSVVLIFFNESRFVEDAIKSVLLQSCTDWELLLVDDGSTDGSSAIALRYANEHPDRIRYLTHERHANRGPSASRNLGIRHAHGCFLAFLDGDDLWLPNKLTEQLGIMAAQPDAAMLFGHSQHWYSWTGHPEDANRDHAPEIGATAGVCWPGQTLLTAMVERRVLTPCPSSMLVRADAVAAIGGFEDEFRNVYEDQVFTAKMCLFGSIFIARNTWDRYRQHPDSAYAVARSTGSNHVARTTFLEWLRSYLIQHHISDPALTAVVEAELRKALNPARVRSRFPRDWISQGAYRGAFRSILQKLRGIDVQL